MDSGGSDNKYFTHSPNGLWSTAGIGTTLIFAVILYIFIFAIICLLYGLPPLRNDTNTISFNYVKWLTPFAPKGLYRFFEVGCIPFNLFEYFKYYDYKSDYTYPITSAPT